MYYLDWWAVSLLLLFLIWCSYVLTPFGLIFLLAILCLIYFQNLLMDVRDKLMFEPEYAGNIREKVPPKSSLRIPWSWLPGALCLLQEVKQENQYLAGKFQFLFSERTLQWEPTKITHMAHRQHAGPTTGPTRII